MTDVLQVEKRDGTGTLATRRLRRQGRVPAVLYGHGEANEHLSLSNTEVKLMLRHHSKTVTLAGAIDDTALVSDIQWDPLGIEVLHLDLMRVNLKEQVEVTVPIQLHGDAVGLREGGVLLENMHEVEIRCPAGSIPDHLTVDVNDLHVGQHRVAGDLTLPEGVELITSAESVIVHVEAPRGGDDEEEGSGLEPEVISRGAAKE